MSGERVRDPAVFPADLLRFLEDPRSYPHGPASVRMVQTHASYVAIAPPFVYKVKKALDLGFLDFSTLTKRRHFCEREVELNRRLCPETYLGVAAIVRRGGELRLEDAPSADHEVVEYAVKMRVLPEEGFLHRQLERGEAGAAEIERIARRLTEFYRAQGPSAEVAEWGRMRRLKLSTDENFEQTEPFIGDTLTRPAWEAIRYFTERFYESNTRLLNRRRAEGRILDCHGDLHAEHIHLTPNRVCIYDCIEFSERLRCIDVASDVGFLAMDLDRHGRRDLSAHLVQRMAEALDDPELPLLIGFYACYRAFVRGKVASMRAVESEVPAAASAASRVEARRYFRLALRYAVARSEPLVVVVMGQVGTGKSTQARALGDALGWEVLSSDRVRKEAFGLPPTERADAATRARLYAQEWTERTYAALIEGALECARRGEGTVLDATFARRAQRDALRDALAGVGITHCFVEVEATTEQVEERLRAREQEPGQVSDARLGDLEMLNSRYQAPDALEDAFHFTTLSADAPEATTTEILRHLVRYDLGQPGGG